MARIMAAEGFRTGWYGKLPASGDFVHRGLDRALIQWWDRWLQRGVVDMLRSSRDAEAAYARAPIWNFVLPAGLGTQRVQFGCLGPGRDRVGRSFPLVLLLSTEVGSYQPRMLEGSAELYRCLGFSMLSALRHGCSVAQLEDSLLRAPTCMARVLDPVAPLTNEADDILSVLNGGHEPAQPGTAPDVRGWPDLPNHFNEHSVSSYWWTNSIDGAAHKSHIHGGMLNSTLFSKLFLGRAGGQNSIL